MKHLFVTLLACPLTLATPASLVTTKAPTLSSIESNVTVVPVTRCVLEQKVCSEFPTFAGSFEDTFQFANTHAGRCWQRAKEYSQWCNNPKGVVTKATFYFADGKTLSASHTSSGMSCEIRMQSCPLYPHVVGSFRDTFDGSDSSLHRCMKRAADFSEWCGFTKGMTATAVFHKADGSTASLSHIATGESCVITQTDCPRYNWIGVFADNYDNSAHSASRCLDRAKDYAVWCEHRKGMATSARFTHQDGSTVESTYIAP